MRIFKLRRSFSTCSKCLAISPSLESYHAINSLHSARLRADSSAARLSFRHQRSQSFVIKTNAPDEPTIYALSTAPGLAAIAVIRVSGPACVKVYQTLCPNKPLPKPRHAAVRSLHESSKTRTRKGVGIIDSEAIVLLFRAPKTVTGEDVIEFHVHGGQAVVKATLAAIGNCNTSEQAVRYAEPGEFTRRAFLNNRLDLPQVEALGDTLSAVTEEQRRLSVQGTVSGLSTRYESWRELLLHARGELEALIDFSEDQHFDESPRELTASVAKQVRDLVDVISVHIANAFKGELLRNGISISLIGSPNVGKSSLLNKVIGRNAAIVNQEAGTTRDVIEIGIDLGGFLCRLGDTAGLRQTSSNASSGSISSNIGEVEQEGIRRAKANALKSDLVILVLAMVSEANNEHVHLQLDPEVIRTANELVSTGKPLVVAVNKMDLCGTTDPQPSQDDIARLVQSVVPGISLADIFYISCRQTDAGTGPLHHPERFQEFVQGLIKKFETMTTALASDDHSGQRDIWEESLGATERQRVLLEDCHGKLQHFLIDVAHDMRASDADDSIDIVLAAERLRSAAHCLAKITGRGEASDVEEVLGVVFEKFCVGK